MFGIAKVAAAAPHVAAGAIKKINLDGLFNIFYFF
jgi:hypothetical protein